MSARARLPPALQSRVLASVRGLSARAVGYLYSPLPAALVERAALGRPIDRDAHALIRDRVAELEARGYVPRSEARARAHT